MRFRPIPDVSARQLRRILSCIEDKPNDCSIWTGSVANGTPMTGLGGGSNRSFSVRRVLAVLQGYTDEYGLWRPKCGNTLCVNLDHCEFDVFKLDRETVEEVLASDAQGVELAGKYGVTTPTIARIRNGTIHHLDKYGDVA